MAFNRKKFESMVSPLPGGSRASYEARKSRRMKLITELQSASWREVDLEGMEKVITGKPTGDITPGEQAAITKAVKDIVGDAEFAINVYRHEGHRMDDWMFKFAGSDPAASYPNNIYIQLQLMGSIDIMKDDDDWWYVNMRVTQIPTGPIMLSAGRHASVGAVRSLYFVCDQLSGVVDLITSRLFL
jgi:hypothetical protein